MNTTDLYYEKMTKTPVPKLILRMAVPTTVSMLISSIYNLADTYFVGTLGESPQAAVGIILTLQSVIQALGFMIGHGSGTFVAKELANRDSKAAGGYTSSAFFLGAAVAAVFAVLGLIFLEPLMYLLGSTETILPYAEDYGMWILLACPAIICSIVMNNNLRYEGMAMSAMIGLTFGGVLNIFGDWLLITKLDMGVYGAGLATAVSQIISFCILLCIQLRKAQSKIRLSYISRRLSTYLSILRMGLPSLIRQGLNGLSVGLLNNLTKPFGDAAIAAMTVVNRYSFIVSSIGIGIGQGFQPVSSFNYQAKKYDRVKRGLIFTTCFAFSVVAVLAVPGIIFPEAIVHAFQKSRDVIVIGAPALRYAAIGVMFVPIAMPVNMLMQSIQRAGTASLLSMLRSGLVFIPVLLVFVHFLGLTGIQIAQPVSDMLVGLISVPFILGFLRSTPEGKE